MALEHEKGRRGPEGIPAAWGRPRSRPALPEAEKEGGTAP